MPLLFLFRAHPAPVHVKRSCPSNLYECIRKIGLRRTASGAKLSSPLQCLAMENLMLISIEIALTLRGPCRPAAAPRRHKAHIHRDSPHALQKLVGY